MSDPHLSPQPNPVATVRPRFRALDGARGVALVLLVFSHGMQLFPSWEAMSSLEHRLVDSILFLTKVSTPLFVWVFGMTMAYVYFDQLENADRFQRLKWRVWRRALYVFVVHQFLVIVIDTYERAPIEQIISRLLYQRLGYWIEVLNFYLVILLITPWVLRWWRRAPLWLRFVIVPALYSLGFILSNVHVHQTIFVWKDVITGHPGSDTFPVLQFSSFYLVGLSFGEFLFEKVRDREMR
ncbi:MAG: heparan-alpha-glucosaminide N-acetyltransferase domain-containing protein, partial [Bacteroidota bacterium]